MGVAAAVELRALRLGGCAASLGLASEKQQLLELTS